MVKFVLIHIKPVTKEEEAIAVVKTLPELRTILSSVKYDGTWLSDTRKLLRYGRGELVIREYEFPPYVKSYKITYLSLKPVYELAIADDDELHTITVDHKGFAAYKCKPKDAQLKSDMLWQTASFTMLADHLVGKELAFEIYTYFEKYLMEFNARSAI